MDPLSHALSGAALARAVPKQPLPRSQVLLLIGLTMAPDADFILKFFSDVLYLRYHRGITHSLLMLPLWTWLIYSLLARWRAQSTTLSPMLIALALAMHILLDVITSFGTMILAPVSDWRASLDLVFIIDPLFSSCLLLPLLGALFWKRRARLLARLALFSMFAYLGLTWTLHQQALEIARKAHPLAQEVAALPLPFSPFFWQLIAVYPDHDQRAIVNLMPGFTGTAGLFPAALGKPYLSAVKSADSLRWQRLQRMNSIITADHPPGVAWYRWFTRFPVLLEQGETHWEFGDLRFGAGLEGIDSPFRLRIENNGADAGQNASAWLIWREGMRIPLSE